MEVALFVARRFMDCWCSGRHIGRDDSFHWRWRLNFILIFHAWSVFMMACYCHSVASENSLYCNDVWQQVEFWNFIFVLPKPVSQNDVIVCSAKVVIAKQYVQRFHHCAARCSLKLLHALYDLSCHDYQNANLGSISGRRSYRPSSTLVWLCHVAPSSSAARPPHTCATPAPTWDTLRHSYVIRFSTWYLVLDS